MEQVLLPYTIGSCLLYGRPSTKLPLHVIDLPLKLVWVMDVNDLITVVGGVIEANYITHVGARII